MSNIPDVLPTARGQRKPLFFLTRPSLAGKTTLYPGPCRHLVASGKHWAEDLPLPLQTSSPLGALHTHSPGLQFADAELLCHHGAWASLKSGSSLIEASEQGPPSALPFSCRCDLGQVTSLCLASVFPSAKWE